MKLGGLTGHCRTPFSIPLFHTFPPVILKFMEIKVPIRHKGHPATGVAKMATHEQLGIDPATPCFWCNTNRRRRPDEGGSDANAPFRLERLMHANHCAATWQQFQYQDHMQ